MKKLLILITLVCTLASCTEVVDLELKNEVRTLAIDGRITDLKGARVNLAITAGYLEEGSIPRIDDANVYLYENGQFIDQLSLDSNGTYSSPYLAKIGRRYHLEIEIPGSYQMATRWQTIPSLLKPVFKIDSLQVRELSRTTTPNVFEPGSYALMYFSEPEGQGDYYRIRRWKNDSAITASIFTFNDEFIDGASFGYKGDNNNNFPAFNFYGPLEEGDSITVEVSSISQDFSDYLALVAEQVFQVGGPFDAPPSEVVGNLRQADNPDEIGYGYFVASALTLESIVDKP